MEQHSDERLEKILKRVQALLARAEHPNTPPAEADTARAKAEQYMAEYRIEESEAIAAGILENKPVKKDWVISDGLSKYRDTYYHLFAYVAQHVGVRWTYRFADVMDDDGKVVWSLIGTMVGYDSDVRYATMLFVSTRLTFSTFMEPRPDPILSDDDNVYNLRNAGLERGRIGAIMGWGGEGSNGPIRVTAAYKRACKARGESPALTGKGNSMKSYRNTFSSTYTDEVYRRLAMMRSGSGVDTTAVVLRGRDEAVEEAFYDFFPNLRPKPRDNSLGEGTSTKRARRARAARYVEPPYSAAGAAAGRRAAAEADLTGSRPAPERRQSLS